MFNLHAQEESNIKFRIEPGVLALTASDNLGLLLNVEPRINISENSAIGLRFGVALNSQKYKNNDSSQFYIEDQNDNGIVSFTPTYDYYLNDDNYRPYLGLGIGYYLFGYTDVFRIGMPGALEGNVSNQLGFLLRGGFESGRTRFGLEYNFIPKADIEIPNGQRIGTVDNSYLGVSIGFTIGGGKS